MKQNQRHAEMKPSNKKENSMFVCVPQEGAL